MQNYHVFPLYRKGYFFWLNMQIGKEKRQLSKILRLSMKVLPLFALVIMIPKAAYAMHIMEGFLPARWAIFWWVITIPFLAAGIRKISRIVKEDPEIKMMLGLSGAFAFILSALKLPSVTGSSSHPTGVGLGTILFGPFVMTVIGFIVLTFQTLLLAHGGVTTLGANTFSMAIVGPLVTYGIYRLGKKGGLPLCLSVFLAATLGNLSTYAMTSFQLALAFPAEVGGFSASLAKFMGIFAVTQIPLAISEGLLTVLILNLLLKYNTVELTRLKVLTSGVK